MFIYKRKVGGKMLIGSNAVVAVTKVTDSRGATIKDAEVSLGFGVQPGVKVQRGEKFLQEYKKSNGKVPFPVFYRQRDATSGAIMGYALDLPLEPQPGAVFEQIEDYRDMVEVDHPVTLVYFHSLAEVTAFEQGLDLVDAGVVGHVKTQRNYQWVVLVHRYVFERFPDEANPVFRNMLAVDPKVLIALNPKRS